jgi:2-amino-4-hydroxy-6-hydroxymethyldihydropteridine diphosphokinase
MSAYRSRARDKTGAMAEVLLAFGGNLGDARGIVDRAITSFCDGDEVRLKARSSDYRTPPWGVTTQSPFINACIAVETDLPPRELLARAHATERAFGRDRAPEQRWGPRILDIDLLTYDDLLLREPDLILPHPRLFERAFVLVPLAEIAPERIIAGRKVSEALSQLNTGGIERLTP